MFSGTVVGEVWATKKVESLRGLKLLLVQPDFLPTSPGPSKDLVVAADAVGAGIGERVIVAYGHGARNALAMGEDIAIEAAIIGIIDNVEMESSYEKHTTP
ncbi:MAG: ethanolamine utilization protein EutN [Planctomycetota bacterium]|nr:MAG: ethanolamine utilization protein EutN [Planctomycetota bacterium]